MGLYKLLIIPHPSEIQYQQGFFEIRANGPISIAYEDRRGLYPIAKKLQKLIVNSTGESLPIVTNNTSQLKNYLFKKNSALPDEGYSLTISEEEIWIEYGNYAGAFHAVSTLKQIIDQSNKGRIPCLRIVDKPDFAARGIMLDISRNKIPKLSTLYHFVDFMADLKLNQLQLYIEGFSFAYPSYPDVWHNETPITGEEIVALDKYCKERFVELVPNQNSFGHMSPWLMRPEFNELAECPDGCEAPWGWDKTPYTLNPLDAKSIQLLENTYDDLLPNFTSELFNVGCDETFDLGQGKSKDLCEKIGKGKVYYDFLMKIYELVDRRGKKMMFWGDILINHPELIPYLPKDIIALEWGYEADRPSAEHCKQFSQSNIPFYVCPGTSSWNSITGLTENSLSNQLNAAVLGKEYGAIGYLNTDWGDRGHWQCLPTSYASFCYGAALSWCVNENKEIDSDIATYLNRFVYLDNNNRMAQFIIDLGNYYLKEKRSNAYLGTGIFRTLSIDQMTNSNTDLHYLKLPTLGVEDFEGVRDYVSTLLDELDKADMQCEDSDIIESEYRNAIRLILHGAKLGLFKLGSHDKEERRVILEELTEDITSITNAYKENWLMRNRSGGLDQSIKKLIELKKQYDDALNIR